MLFQLDDLENWFFLKSAHKLIWIRRKTLKSINFSFNFALILKNFTHLNWIYLFLFWCKQLRKQSRMLKLWWKRLS